MIADKIEILAPAGGFAQLEAAISAKADAIYFGVGELNMRAGAAVNFTIDDLATVVERCHSNNIKAYLTINTVLYDEELGAIYNLCDMAKKANVDACIAGDIAVLQYLRKINMPIHMTVQCNICNMEAVRFYAQFADVMVLARELPLESITNIANTIREENICGPSGQQIRLEIFVHGALCVAISGKCYMSLASFNKSANRGMCLQNCRRSYRVYDASSGIELEIDNHHVMSPKDLCTIEFFDKIIESGVAILKIEGRGRAADYVNTAVSVYRDALEHYVAGNFTQELVPVWTAKLREVFNRDFWMGGYYLGHKLGEWCGSEGNQSTLLKHYVGKVTNFYSRLSVAEIRIETLKLQPNDRILITGNTTGAVDMTVEELRAKDSTVDEATAAMTVSLKVPQKVRNGDKIYLLEERGDRIR